MDVVLGDGRVGEVNCHIGTCQGGGSKFVALVQAGDELEAVGVLDGLADGGPHAPCGANNGNSNAHAGILARDVQSRDNPAL